MRFAKIERLETKIGCEFNVEIFDIRNVSLKFIMLCVVS